MLEGLCDTLLAVGGLVDHVDVRLVAEHAADRFAKHARVVDKEDVHDPPPNGGSPRRSVMAPRKVSCEKSRLTR